MRGGIEEQSAAMVFASNVRQVRRHLAWTQQDLAERLGCDRSAISRIECNDREATVGEADHIASVLGVPLAGLLGHQVITMPVSIDTRLQRLAATGQLIIRNREAAA